MRYRSNYDTENKVTFCEIYIKQKVLQTRKLRVFYGFVSLFAINIISCIYLYLPGVISVEQKIILYLYDNAPIPRLHEHIKTVSY